MEVETLRAIEGIGIFPVISLVLFVLVFSVMLVRVLRLDRRRVASYAAMALDDQDAARKD